MPFPTIALKQTLKSPPQEEGILKSLATHALTPFKTTEYFLFMIENLREDYICPEIAPNFSKFPDENISFDLAFAASNTTNYSWFSLFHARYP